MRASIPYAWLALLAGCDGANAPAAQGTAAVEIVSAATPPPLATGSPPADRRDENVRPVAVPPPPAPSPAVPAMRPAKDFTDPPLPRELRDDGGLLPLPAAPRNHQVEEDRR